MVYFYTSGNVKMLRNILIDYESTKEVTPSEYMKIYLDKCPENTEDAKLTWITETFLGVQKHKQFLKDIASRLSEQLSEEEQDYFMIAFYAITFQIQSKDMQFLYKCLFNLSKSLLSTFTKFMSNNEVLTFISQVARACYDTNFITEKIVSPLFAWQPYISEMGHSYAEYIKKIESRKTKPLTVPVQPNVLNHGSFHTKEAHPFNSRTSALTLPKTPPNSIHTRTKRMLSKSVIDEKLKQSYEKNKQKATHLLNDVKNNDFHHAQVKSDKNKFSNIRDETEYVTNILPKLKYKPISTNVSKPVKDNAANVKRINKRVQEAEQEEVQWLANIMNSRNTVKIEELLEYDRQERERERLLDMEKKHLMGQISHEEALLAKKKQTKENKKRYEEFIKEKESWDEEIEYWKKLQIEQNRKQIEKLSLLELNVLEAKHEVSAKNKETADTVRRHSEQLLALAMKKKQDELDHRIKIIKEIKFLSVIAKKARVPKIIDLTETSGLGLLCEMSIAELQERMNAMKIGLNEELERKKSTIIKEKLAAKQELEDNKNSIKTFMSEKALSRKENKTKQIRTAVPSVSSKELKDLKKTLEEKRKLRMKLTKS